LKNKAITTRERYQGVIDKYLVPTFVSFALGDLTPFTVQRYITGLGSTKLSHESIDKIRDVLAAILKKAAYKKYRLIQKDPMEYIELPRAATGRRTRKPHITPEQFDDLVNAIPEPYATMFYVAVYTGLRVSELIGLKWDDIGLDSITVNERYCRGDWSEPKRKASNTTIGVDRWRRPADPAPKSAHRRREGRRARQQSNSQIQSGEIGRSNRSGFPEREGGQADAR
jgi:integrase